MQLSVLSKSMCDKLTSYFRVPFKRKLHLPRSFPNAALHSREFLGLNHLFDQQILAKTSDVYNQFNARGILKQIVLIKDRKLQSRLDEVLFRKIYWHFRLPCSMIMK